ncbi:MAG: type II toxin-antitoxin system RelE/ParE family toxin [Terracidiphilus sp.]
MNEALDRIEANPFSSQVFYRNTRKVLLEKFPYGVFYVIKDTRIYIIAVIHHKRNPKLARRIAE